MKNKLNLAYVIIFCLVFYFICWVSVQYFNFFETNPPLTREEWGQLGDYFGGTLNPIFGFLSFIALLVTIYIQSKELNLSRTELELSRGELKKSANALAAQNKAIELQSFEQTFFSWLSTYRELLGSITEKRSGQSYLGKEALHDIWGAELNSDAIYRMMCGYEYGQVYLRPEFGNYDEAFKKLNDRKKLEILTVEHGDVIVKNIQQNWTGLYGREEYQLDSFFRTAYKLLTWIDSLDSSRLSNADKWLYVSIFRSQLSWIEMVFFFYNGLTEIGEKFKPIIEKYALFDNLNLDSDICIKVVQQNASSTNRYSQEAFDSDLAKKKFGII